MMFRNSVRLLFSNFSTVWKILLYKIFVWTIVLGIATTVAMPIITLLQDNNFFVEVKSAFEGFMLNMDMYSILNSLIAVINNLVNIINNNIEAILPNLIGVILIVFGLGYFLNNLASLATTETLNGYMSSNANLGFSNTYVKNFLKSFVYSLFKTIINLPIIILICITVYNMLPLFASSNELVALFAPLIIISVGVLLTSLYITLFSGVAASIVVHDLGVIKGHKKGFRAVSRRFFKTLSNAIVIVLTIFIFNIFILSMTAGAGLIISLPSSTFLVAIFGIVMYYGSNGMRYYVDPDTVLTPKKLEEQDKVKKAKFII